MLAMPNANGVVANNGTGTVKVNSANSLRNYAITDMNGNVIATLPGTALQSGAFTGLPVNAQYQVYELTTAQNPAAGTPITSVVASDRSQPTVVNVPAVGANATGRYRCGKRRSEDHHGQPDRTEHRVLPD